MKKNPMDFHQLVYDLQEWERSIKEKDKRIKTNRLDEKESLPPVRARVESLSKETTRPNLAAKQTSAASHTYDYFRDKWDKFDIESALKEVDEVENKQLSQKDIKSSAKQNSRKEKRIPDIPSRKKNLYDDYTGNGHMGTLGSIDKVSSILKGPQDTASEALSEKEQGNEYFKNKKYSEAIDCYTRSILLYPTAVSFANRAMAYMKVGRYAEVEYDCSEAINLDDRYVKAYSRRGAARKELGKLIDAIDDFEFGLRLEPGNKELQKHFEEAQKMNEKNLRRKLPDKKAPVRIEEITKDSSLVCGDPKQKSVSGQNASLAKKSVKMKHVESTDNQDVCETRLDNNASVCIEESTMDSFAIAGSDGQRGAISTDQASPLKEISVASNSSAVPLVYKTSAADKKQTECSNSPVPLISKTSAADTKRRASNNKQESTLKEISVANSSSAVPLVSKLPAFDKEHVECSSSAAPLISEVSVADKKQSEFNNKQNIKDRKQNLFATPPNVAERAASSVTATISKKMPVPKSAFEFETLWKGFRENAVSKAELLKTVSPTCFPQLFKDALSAPLLIDIVRCLQNIFKENQELAIQYLEHLTKVSRFDMTVMCLSSKDKAEFRKNWELFFTCDTSSDHTREALKKLQSKYCR